MQLRAGTLVALAGLVAGGVAIGRAWAPSSSLTPAMAVQAPSSFHVMTTGGLVAHLDDADVRRIRDEVVAAMGTRTTTSPEPSDPVKAAMPASPSPEQVAADETANRLVDDAIASGRWTDADAVALRRGLSAMSKDARLETVRRLGIAINRGNVHFETAGPPL